MILIVLLIACNENQEDSELDAPNINGAYQVLFEGASGCEGDYHFLRDWGEGPLSISGDNPDKTTFKFLHEMEFTGRVEPDFTWSFTGLASWDSADLDIYGGGSVFGSEGNWELKGALEARVDEDGIESNDCQIDATIKATQL